MFDRPSAEKEPHNPYNIHAAAQTQASEKHPNVNEDSLLELPEKGAFGVFDGVGGHAAGDKASRLARDYVGEQLQNLSESLSPQEIQEALHDILIEAHQKVAQAAREAGNNGGTTAIIAKLWQNAAGERVACVGSVGDSRFYLVRTDGSLEQISVDDDGFGTADSSYNEAREELSHIHSKEDLADCSPLAQVMFNNRNRITQALGSGTVKPHTYAIGLQPGERLVLSSDGIHDNLSDQEMAKILAESGTQDGSAKRLVDAAVDRSQTSHVRAKMDDMSSIVVDIEPESDNSRPTIHLPETPRRVEREAGSIAEARSFKELYQVIKDLPEGGIRGSKLFYPADDLIHAIDHLRTLDSSQIVQGQMPLTLLTNNQGLRQKVFQLLTGPKQPTIAHTQNFDQLYDLLDSLPEGGMFGSDGTFYPADKLKYDIQQLRLLAQESGKNNVSLLSSITRTNNLREKVQELIDRDRR